VLDEYNEREEEIKREEGEDKRERMKKGEGERGYML
jgi:hypothetical protein